MLEGEGIEEIWCGLSIRASDGTFIRPEVRDLLFASLEDYLAPAVFEPRYDWPTGEAGWFEAVRLGLREPGEPHRRPAGQPPQARRAGEPR